MLFSSADYPLFLIAVFFLYALSRYGGAHGRWARIAVMVLLGDLVFLLVSKDPDTLWDPLGNVLYRLAAGSSSHVPWPEWPIGTLAIHWTIGLAVVLAAITLGRRAGGWIASDRGQWYVARGIVVVLAIVAAAVAIASGANELDAMTAQIVRYGHLLLLVVLGTGIGAAQHDTYRPLGRVVILFVASSLFYHAWAASMPGPYRYLLGLLLGTIVLDYYLAIWIENTENPAARKALVILSLCSNLGILAFFKYTDFLTHDVMHLPVSRLHLILPAGISFHTFQSLSYTIDVYRKQLRATRSAIQFATFVLFFPQLVAGPIVRAQDLLPQLSDLPALDTTRATDGLFRILVGLFKKIALADTLALSIVDRVFENPERFSGLEVLVGVYAYALQIYLDFSAYSDIAIGSAQVLGFSLPENFRTPYRSANIQEFWRRWHISLSTWLRDYLYKTLGGNRGAAWRTYLNLILTMVLGGLWHGASWAFIVWGALHGFGLAVTRFFQRATAVDPAAAWRLFGRCGVVAAVGVAFQWSILPQITFDVPGFRIRWFQLGPWHFDGGGAWEQLVTAWLFVTPLWAVLTAWLGADRSAAAKLPVPRLLVASFIGRLVRAGAALLRSTLSSPRPQLAESLRIVMCAAGITFLAALGYAEPWTWIPLAILTFSLGLLADLVERGEPIDVVLAVRRAFAVVLVFNYVCLAWIFFRASSFDSALVVLRQIAGGETDHANLVPMVTTALVVGFLCHFFAAGSFRWLRDRFMEMPAPAQGFVLAAAALILRELSHAKIVPFIYFQF